MKHNLLLLGGIACVLTGLLLFSVALGVFAAGVAMIALSFAFLDNGPAPEDRHIPRPDLEPDEPEEQ